MRFLVLLVALWSSPAAATELVCGDPDDPCVLPSGRSYHVRLPDEWDGTSPMPVLLHFHGWARQGSLIVRHQRISGSTRRRGVLLIAPNGQDRTWDFWRPGSPDTSFARAVLEDVKTRYPVDLGRVWVSGYSWGANMAWRFACEDGADIAALLAISGTLDQEEDCETAPGEVRQVYGLTDTVLPFPMGPGEDQTYPVQLWREALGCNAGEARGPWNAVSFLTLERTAWEDCTRGRVNLDIHPGGHFIPHGWIARQIDEMMGVPPQYP